jgi:plasmid stabilization system protein ParE
VTRALRSIEPASEELEAAIRWYEIQRPDLGVEFLEAVAATISLIEANPEIGTPIRDDPRTRRLLVVRFPYQVAYRLRASEIVIVAFAHLKRRPGYWRDRT